MRKSAWMFVVIIVACLATTISAAPFLMTPTVPFFSGRTYLPGEEWMIRFDLADTLIFPADTAVIYLVAGNYDSLPPTWIPDRFRRVEIIGAGRDQTIITFAPDTSISPNAIGSGADTLCGGSFSLNGHNGDAQSGIWSNRTVILHNVKIQRCVAAICMDNGRVEADTCLFSGNNDAGIRLQNRATGIIRDSFFPSCSTGVFAVESSYVEVIRCGFSSDGGSPKRGIVLNSSAGIVRGGEIRDPRIGIVISGSIPVPGVRIYDNIIHGITENGIFYSSTEGDSVWIYNNTIVGYNGLWLVGGHPARFVNNIVYVSGEGCGIGTPDSSLVHDGHWHRYNCYFAPEGNPFWPIGAFGRQWGEIFDNPRLTDDYGLYDISPCIDAGDPDFPRDSADGTIIDIGANSGPPYETYVYVSPNNKVVPLEITLSIYPNPFNSSTAIEFEGRVSTIEIINMLGQAVLRKDLGHSEKGTIYWNGRDENGNILPSGKYFCRLWSPSGQSVVKTVVFLH